MLPTFHTIDPHSTGMMINSPGAECAGELSVSLVHTLGVFEMFVLVVFVGKDFPTPLTGVALRFSCYHNKTLCIQKLHLVNWQRVAYLMVSGCSQVGSTVLTRKLQDP